MRYTLGVQPLGSLRLPAVHPPPTSKSQMKVPSDIHGTRLQSRDVGDMRDSDRVTKAGARITRYVTINVNMGYIDNT